VRALLVSGSSDESTLTAGLSLPRSGTVDRIISCRVRSFPNPAGELTMWITDGVGQEIWRDSIFPQNTTPHQMVWGIGLSDYSTTRKVGDVMAFRPLPDFELDPSWSVKWGMVQTVGNVGSITDIVVVLDGEQTGATPPRLPRPSPGQRARKSFPAALLNVVQNYGKTPAAAVQVLGGGASSSAGQLAQGGGLVRGKLAQGGGLVRGKMGKGGGFSR